MQSKAEYWIARMREMCEQEPISNEERAHIIIARGNCGNIAEEWAKDFIATLQSKEP